MRRIVALLILPMGACAGDPEPARDTAAASALTADTTAAFGHTPVDTTPRSVTRPARVDRATDQQKALRNRKVGQP